MADLARAAFGRGPFAVSVGGADFTFPYMSAAVWLDMITDPDWVVRILRSMSPLSYEKNLVDGLENGRLGREDLIRIARSTMAEAGGRPWWEVERLVSALGGSDGRILGRVLTSGIDPERVSLAGFCAAVWSSLTHNVERIDLMKLESQLTMPPPEALDDGFTDETDVYATVQQLRSMPGIRTG